MVDRRRRELWSKVAQHDGGVRLERRLPIGVGIAGKVAVSGQMVNIADPHSHPDFNPEIDHQPRFRTWSILAIPLMSRAGVVIGVAQVLNRQGEPTFTESDEQRLREFAPSLGIILETCSRMLSGGAQS